MIRILPLTGITTAQIHDAQQDAFSEYPFQWSQQDLEKLMNRRGYDSALSFGAFDGDKLVSFTLNCTGTFNGLPTAYDTMSGTRKPWRRQGLSGKLFDASVAAMKARGILQYSLDVLQNNTDAVSVYKKAGFKITRDFNTYRQNSEAIQLKNKALPGEISIKRIDLAHAQQMMAMCDFIPSWQNSFEALERVPADFIMIGAFDGNNLAGYGIIAPESGDITQLAVAEGYRRKGIGSALLRELVSLNTFPSMKCVNVASDCIAMNAFFDSIGLPKIVTLYEMIKPIDNE